MKNFSKQSPLQFMAKQFSIFAIIFAMVLGMTSCETTDAYSGERKTSDATKGAGIGALAGVLLGAATGDNAKDRRERAIKGALLGGAIGGGIGAYMDKQENKLRKELEGTGVRVKREGNNLRLIMPGNITFASGNADINANFYRVLNSVAKVLVEFNKTAIEISGHTDSTGGNEMNQSLSERRAESVARYLNTRKISDKRMSVIGYGSTQPMASNGSADGRQENRRVELELIPNQ